MWYLVTEPKLVGGQTLNEFGFTDIFNGIGVFVYKKQGRLFLRAFEDLGVSKFSYDYIQSDSDVIANGGDSSKGCELVFKDN